MHGDHPIFIPKIFLAILLAFQHRDEKPEPNLLESPIAPAPLQKKYTATCKLTKL